jgi:hypothetical protein
LVLQQPKGQTNTHHLKKSLSHYRKLRNRRHPY